MIGIDGFSYRQELEQFCLLFLRCREPKEMSALDKWFWGDGYAWKLLSHYDDDATISYNNENRNSLRASSPFKGYREKSRASGMRKETREQGAGIESETSLTCSLATRNGEAATSPWHFLVVVRVRFSVSQFTLGNPRKNPSYFHTKQRLLWLHVPFFTHFNQPLINNIATRAWRKKSSHKLGTTTPKCALR